MAGKRYNSDGPSAEERALERFTELMIKKNIVYQGRLEETVVYRELYGMAEEPVRTRI